MSIEEEIKQGEFANDHQRAGVNILFTGSWLHQASTNRLKPFGITPEQFNVLRILRGAHPNALKLADITNRMIDKNSNATRLVEKLRLKGFVTRKLCEENRRQVDIAITAKGLDVLKKIDATNEGWHTMMKNITKSEAKELSRILDKLRG